MKQLHPITRIVLVLCTLLLISTFYVPLWQILMWAPQYPEGLKMKIWIDDITGDVKIISALNHYIGMRPIEVSMFPEFAFMKYILAAIVVAGLMAAIVNRRIALMIYIFLLITAGIAALIDYYLWGYDYGHNLDPNAPIVVPGMAYQPPLIGYKDLLNFTAYSGPDIGGWIFIAVTAVLIVMLVLEFYKFNKPAVSLILLFSVASFFACSPKPEPIVYGSDMCYTCKMTIMDKHFGGEVVTRKGKVYKFDDINCMVNFLNSGYLDDREVAFRLVVDYAQPAKLVDATQAFYLKSGEIYTPMASQIAAFEYDSVYSEFKRKWNAIYLTWGELIAQFK